MALAQHNQDSPEARRLDEIRAERRRLEEEERAIYLASVAETDPALKVCPDSMATLIAGPSLFPRLQPPFRVTGIAWSGDAGEGWIASPWQPTEDWPEPWCSVRLVGKEHEGRTFLGIALGDAYTSVMVSRSQDGILTVGPAAPNPCMYLPELRRVVFGHGSWWAPITDPAKVREITDGDLARWADFFNVLVPGVVAAVAVEQPEAEAPPDTAVGEQE
jgi:hypothetical protein